jgi:phage terminase large subunit-like protein
VAVLYGDPEDPETWDKAVMHHVGEFKVLEDQMKSWLPEDWVSPDHMDATSSPLWSVRLESRRFDSLV